MNHSLALVAMLAAAGALAGCASKEVRAEREALQVLNRCVVAVQEINQALYESCLSRRLQLEQARPGVAAADAAGTVSAGTLRAWRDIRPHRTRIDSVAVAPDARRVVFETQNRSRLLEREIEHRETIVVIRQADRWVIDRDCCEYIDSKFVDPEPAGGAIAPVPLKSNP